MQTQYNLLFSVTEPILPLYLHEEPLLMMKAIPLGGVFNVYDEEISGQ